MSMGNTWSKKNFLNQGDGSYLDRVSKAFLAMPQELQVMIKIVMSIVSRVRINIDTFDKTFKGSCTYYVIADREGGVSPNDYSIT